MWVRFNFLCRNKSEYKRKDSIWRSKHPLNLVPKFTSRPWQAYIRASAAHHPIAPIQSPTTDWFNYQVAPIWQFFTCVSGAAHCTSRRSSICTSIRSCLPGGGDGAAAAAAAELSPDSRYLAARIKINAIAAAKHENGEITANLTRRNSFFGLRTSPPPTGKQHNFFLLVDIKICLFALNVAQSKPEPTAKLCCVVVLSGWISTKLGSWGVVKGGGEKKCRFEKFAFQFAQRSRF